MWKVASILVGIVLVLLALGIVMLASTSQVRAQTEFNDPNYFLTRQAVWLALGGVAGVLAARFDYHRLRWVVLPLGAFTLTLLVMVIVPGVGVNINGSSRWLRFGSVNVQPSELAKLSTVLLLAWWMKRVQRRSEEFVPGLLVPGGLLAATLGLVFVEPDFGTTMLIALVGGAVLLLGGARLAYLAVAAVSGLALFAFAVMQDEVRMNRIIAFLDPEAHAQKESFQLMNALYAFVIGGGSGAGFGRGMQKRFYLPEAHTDFIFAIIGEELGVVASIGVVVLFLGFFLCGMTIAARAADRFGRLLAFGLTLMVSVQAAINIGVVTGCLPTKGLALPFISYGGSNLLVCCAMVGILVNVALHAGGEIEDEDTQPFKDRLDRV